MLARVALAAICLFLFGAAQQPADLGKLTKALKDKDVKVRLKAAKDLGAIGADAQEADRAIVDAMMEKWPASKEDYLDALEKVSPKVHKHIVTLLVDELSTAQKRAINALSDLGPNANAAVPVIAAYYQADKATGFGLGPDRPKRLDCIVTAAGIGALGKIGTNDQLATATVLDAIAPSAGTGKEQVAPGEIVVRLEAIKAIKSMKVAPKAAVKALVLALPESRLAPAACDALGEFGAQAKDALPALNKAKLSDKQATRDAATKAVEKISK